MVEMYYTVVQRMVQVFASFVANLWLWTFSFTGLYVVMMYVVITIDIDLNALFYSTDIHQTATTKRHTPVVIDVTSVDEMTR